MEWLRFNDLGLWHGKCFVDLGDGPQSAQERWQGQYAVRVGFFALLEGNAFPPWPETQN